MPVHRTHILLLAGCLVGCEGTSTAAPELPPEPPGPFHILAVRPSGTGEGQVSLGEVRVCSALRGVWWGRCEIGVESHGRIALTASAAPGSRFSGWGGAHCDRATAICMVDVVRSDTVSARFERENPRDFVIEFVSHRPHPEWVARSLSAAASRWERVVVGDLQDVTLPVGIGCGEGEIESRVVDDVLIAVEAPEARIEGGGAYASNCWTEARGLRSLPVYGGIRVPHAGPEADAVFRTIAAHEIGHVLGIGTLFHFQGLVEGAGSPRAHFLGPGTMEVYGALIGQERPRPVPLENDGGAGVAEVHWERDSVPDELMSVTHGPISILSVSALADLGYTVDTSRVEGYRIAPAPPR